MSPLIVGLTGGIGSGKSTVAKIFEAFSIPCYSADVRAKQLMVEDSVLMRQLKEHFGEELYQEGRLNRAWLASRIFHSESDRIFVNSVVHPAVKQDFERWVESNSSPYVLKEAAILFETGGYKDLDATILVTAPEDVRVSRVMKRDGATESEVKSRIRSQWSDDRKMKLADFVLLNDGEHALIPQVKAIHETILRRTN